MVKGKKGRERPCENDERPKADAAREPEFEGTLAEGVDEIAGEIDGLRSELEDVNRKWLRTLADLDNYKKRVSRERARWVESAREEALVPFLDVVDNFERAMRCEAPDDEGCDASFRQGMEMIFRHLMEVLERQGVRPIEAAGAEFDPELHEAVSCVESNEHETNTVIEEIQRGYVLGERLLRPSKVVVAA